MARTKSFDRTDVTASARTLFWRRGYDCASTAELEEATGLSRSSIYNTFENKRGLFDSAVQSYLDDVVRPLLGSLNRDPTPTDALDDYLGRLARALRTQAANGAARGCLLLSTASSSLADDPEVRATIVAYRTELADAIRRGTDAVPAPQGRSDQRAQLAEVVTAAVVGALTMASVDPEAAASSLEAMRSWVSTPLINS